MDGKLLDLILYSCLFYAIVEEGSVRLFRVFGSRVASTINSTVATVICILFINRSITDDTFSKCLLVCCSGYFIVDIYILVLMKKKTVYNILMIVHHLIALYWLFSMPICFYTETANFFVTEASTPFINICFYEKMMGRENRMVYIGSGIVAWNIFLTTRIFNTGMVIYSMWNKVIIYQKMIMIVLWGMNFSWFYKITQMITSVLK